MIFIPAHNTIMSVDLACLFILHVFSKYGIPFHVTSDRDLEFVFILEPAMSDSFSKRTQPAPTPVIIDGEPKYEISQIVNSKIDCWWACKLLYKIIWLEYKNTKDESE